MSRRKETAMEKRRVVITGLGAVTPLGHTARETWEAAKAGVCRGHFAEFLDNASSAGLRILSSSTCVGLRYGYGINNSGFS